MSRDFTLEKYSELIRALEENYKIMKIVDYLATPNTKNHDFIAMLRHDVDKHPERSLEMAKLESLMGIRSSYYFRMVPEIFDIAIIKEIETLGHEIGYHYEVLDKANGDIEKALIIFGEELEEMRKTANIRTACMHGSPLKKWKNLDIWQKSKPEEFGLIGEPFISIDYTKVQYYTDTGRRWDGEKYSIDDHVDQPKEHMARSTDDIISIIGKTVYPQVLIQTHPQRWTGGTGAWMKELVGQNVKNVGKGMLKSKN